MAIKFTENDDLVWRIDAPEAQLINGEWQFQDAQMTSLNGEDSKNLKITLETTLTPKEIEDSFSSTETISFWKLPKFIKTLERTGFKSSSLKIHFHSMLAIPLFFASLIIIAACVTLRPPRSQNTFKMIAIGVGSGFALFFISNFMKALGASDQIPIIVAAWSPVMISAFAGIGILLFLEDG
jgi:lipopolysaccharide export system permease protein